MNSLNEEGDEYMETKYQVIALVGRSGAGKDYIVRATCAAHPTIFHRIISCSTRPYRGEYENQEPDYQFITLENFTRKILAGNMLEATENNGWFSGTLASSLDPEKINIGVFNLEALQQLQEKENLNILIIKVDVLDKICLLRELSRTEHPDCEEICRQFLIDSKSLLGLKKDFSTINNDEEGKDADLLQNTRIGLQIEDLWNELENGLMFAEALAQDMELFTKSAEDDKDKMN